MSLQTMPISSKKFTLPPLVPLPHLFPPLSPSFCSSQAETLFSIFPLIVYIWCIICVFKEDQKHREYIKRGVLYIIFRNIKETVRRNSRILRYKSDFWDESFMRNNWLFCFCSVCGPSLWKKRTMQSLDAWLLVGLFLLCDPSLWI